MEEKALGVITDSAEAGSLLAAGPPQPPHGPHSQPEGALVEKGSDSEAL